MQLRGAWAWTILVIVFLSLGANLFLAGFLVERWRSQGRFFGPPPTMQMLADFPPDIRRAILRELWNDRAQFRDTFAEIGAKRRGLLDAMRATPLDENRLRTELRDIGALSSRLQERAQNATVDVLRRMTPEQRAAIGERRQWQRGNGQSQIARPWDDEDDGGPL